MKTIYYIASSVLGRPVLIVNKTAAETFAQEQTDHTGTPHVAEPVELHDDATELNGRIDAAVREQTLAALSPAQRRAMNVQEPTVPAKPAPAAVEKTDAPKKA